MRVGFGLWFRAVVLGILLLAFYFAMFSLILRRQKSLGTAVMATVVWASLLGGSATHADLPDYTMFYVGLDFFTLNVLFTGLLFVTLEKMCPKAVE